MHASDPTGENGRTAGPDARFSSGAAATFSIEAAGQSLTFFPCGTDRLDALLRLIGEAQTRIDIAFYIFSPDLAGTAIRNAMIEAARRGVQVTVIVDGFGAAAGAAFFSPLEQAGGKFHVFMARWTRRYLIRNHQKIVLVDDRVAMLGGFNVEDGYFSAATADSWDDLGVEIEGPVVAQVARWFAELHDWVTHPAAQFRAIRRKVRQWDAGSGAVQLLIGGPTRGLSGWARRVSDDLAQGSRLDMVMAYFSPPRKLMRRIAAISEKGQARLVMAGKSDNAATIGASRALYRQLLKAGAQIWEFQPRKLHSKLIVLDDAVYIGSANFDMRSLYLNLEIVLRIEDAALANRMRELIDGHIAASQLITPELYRQWSSPANRLRWWCSWLLVGVLDYTVSRKLNLGL